MIISEQAMYERHKILRVAVKIWNFFESSLVLGDGPVNKLKVVYLFFRWKISLKLAIVEKILPPVRRLSIVYEGHVLALKFPNDPSFPHILYEVFVCRDYGIALSRPPKCILDVGANIGLACLFYAYRYPEAQIYAIEPNAENFRYLELNTAHLKNVIREPLGLYSHSGKERLYLSKRFCGMHSIVRPNDGAFEEIETLTLDDFLSSRGIGHVDVLKIDVEGAEEAILMSTHSLDLVDYIVGELHVDVIDPTKVLSAISPHFKVSSHPTAWDLAVFTAENKRLAVPVP